MGYLSIRNLPIELERKLVAEARRRHTTKTAIVIECLEKGIAPAKKKPSLREWAGKLSAADFRQVTKASAGQRSIDPEMWE